jgi:protein-disulfide isomerase
MLLHESIRYDHDDDKRNFLRTGYFMFQNTFKILSLPLALLAFSTMQPAKAAEDIEASLSEAQTSAVNDMIHQFIMNNPEVLLESVELYQKRLASEQVAVAAQASGDVVAEIKSGAFAVPFAGNLESDILVVEFLDYNCGFCRRGFDAIQTLIADEDHDVKIAFVELPVLGQSSREAAKFALAADMQGKYFEFHTALFGNAGPKSEKTFVKIAEGLELDIDKLKADANGDEVEAILERNRDVANRLNISGTPAFIVGTEFVPGYIPYETMKSMLETQK